MAKSKFVHYYKIKIREYKSRKRNKYRQTKIANVRLLESNTTTNNITGDEQVEFIDHEQLIDRMSNIQIENEEIEDSSSSSEEEIEEDVDNSSFIYNGSMLTRKEFSLSYIWMCQKLNLAQTHRNELLNYIRSLLPSLNKIPSSYNQTIKSVRNKAMQKEIFKLCLGCYEKNENCMCDDIHPKRIIDVARFDIQKQFKSIIKNNWHTIQMNKGI